MSNAPLENPFASTHSLDENPFDDPISSSTHVAAAKPAYDPSLASREEELNRRARELEEREQQLRQTQEHIRLHGRNNWPPFFPLIFHSINDEIPSDSRPLVWHLYYLWLILLGTLVINMIACIFVLVAGSSDGGRDLGSSIGYIPIIGILSFLLWYRPIYNAYMKEQALYYYFYFFFCGWHLVFSIYMIIGIPGSVATFPLLFLLLLTDPLDGAMMLMLRANRTGSAGLIQTIQMFANGHIAAGVLGTVATVGWVAQGLGNTFYYRQIWMHNTAQGHTFNNAKSELATHWAKRQFGFGSSS